MKIVPSILAESFEDFLTRLKQAEKWTDYVQIDLMDGVFVKTRSFSPERLNTVTTSLSFEVHIMGSDPLGVVNSITHCGLKKVIFHAETEVDPPAVINTLKGRGLSAGLAFKPETALQEYTGAADQADTLLFLAVDPGRYGSPFRRDVLKKIGDARRDFPDKIISVDGGVSLDNLKIFFDMGVDYVCVGSRIFLKGNPEENYRMFQERVRELEGA